MMLKMTRDALDLLLMTTPAGEIPPLGFDWSVRTFSARSNRASHAPLELAANYYETLQDLLNKGLVQPDPPLYRLTTDGERFVDKMRSRGMSPFL